MVFLVFPLLFAAIMAVAHVFVFGALVRLLSPSPLARRGLKAFFIAAFIVSAAGFPLYRLFPHDAIHPFIVVFHGWVGVLLLLLSAVATAGAGAYLLSIYARRVEFKPERRVALTRLLGYAALGSTGLMTVIATANARRLAAIVPVDVTISRLPRAFDGLRVAQLSDLHIGDTQDGAWLRSVVDRTNALSPDVIVITGDLVDGSVEALRGEVASLADLRAPLGVYFITGNHEYYSGAEAWCAHIATLGLRVLRNERVELRRADAIIDLIGVDDYHSDRFPGGKSDLAAAVEGRDTTRTALLLAHQPIEIFNAAAHGIDLQLSGHTHGGQIWPFGLLVKLQQPYVAGLHTHAQTKTQIYVSRGTGCWGPPMRLNAPAEITLLTLRTASA